MLEDRGKSYTEKLLRFKDYHTHCKDAQVLTVFIFNENKSKKYVINSDQNFYYKITFLQAGLDRVVAMALELRCMLQANFFNVSNFIFFLRI